MTPNPRFAVFLALLLFPAAAFPADTEKERVKTQGGIRFNLPEDWPIEKRGAALGPISVEEYVSRKLDALEGRMAALEGKISSLQKQLQETKEEYEKANRLRSKEGLAP